MMLVPFGISMLCGGSIVLAILYRRKRLEAKGIQPTHETTYSVADFPSAHNAFLNRPSSWLAIRSRDLNAAQQALRLHNPKPCSWLEGIIGDQKLFLAPPMNGWILIFGSLLPNISDDVDASFRFLTHLSRKVGHVQFFEANRALNHHAWVRLEGGRVVRAYAWAGSTLWNQGKQTRGEIELGLKCFHYFETPENNSRVSDTLCSNTENVPALAARWSLDPASFDHHATQHVYGIAGEAPRLY